MHMTPGGQAVGITECSGLGLMQWELREAGGNGGGGDVIPMEGTASTQLLSYLPPCGNVDYCQI